MVLGALTVDARVEGRFGFTSGIVVGIWRGGRIVGRLMGWVVGRLGGGFTGVWANPTGKRTAGRPLRPKRVLSTWGKYLPVGGSVYMCASMINPGR